MLVPKAMGYPQKPVSESRAVHAVQSFDRALPKSCVAAVAANQLGLPRPASQEERLSRFLPLTPPYGEGAALELQRWALVTASVYLTHCWSPHAAEVSPVICMNALKLTLRGLL